MGWLSFLEKCETIRRLYALTNNYIITTFVKATSNSLI